MAPLHKDLAKAERATKKAVSSMQATMDKYGASIKRIGRTMSLAGASIIASLTGVVAATVTLGDNFDKMSLRTGMAVEQLSKLSYAAKISGTDNKALETSLRFLARRMDETASGVGEAKEVFDKLGISVTDTSGDLRSQMSVLTEAADKIAAMTDETRQVAHAMDIFGARSGPQLLPLLKQGSAGIEELTKRAEELGLVLSTESAKAAAEFNDSMTDLRESVKMAAYQIGNVLLPMLKPLVERLTETVGQVIAWTKENPRLTRTLATFAAVVGGLMTVGGPLLMMAPAIISITTAIASAGGLVPALAAAAGALSPAAPIIIGLAALAAALLLVRSRMKEYNRELKAMAVTVMVKAFDDARSAGVGFAEATEQITEKLAELGITAENAAEHGVERFFRALLTIADLLPQVPSGMKALGASFKVISEETQAALDEIEAAYFELTHTQLELLNKLWEAEEKRLEDLEVGEKALNQARILHYKDYVDEVISLERQKQEIIRELEAAGQSYKEATQEELWKQAGYTEKKILELKYKRWEAERKLFLDSSRETTKRLDEEWKEKEKELRKEVGGVKYSEEKISQIKNLYYKAEYDKSMAWGKKLAADKAKLDYEGVREVGRQKEAETKIAKDAADKQRELDEKALVASLKSLAEELKETEAFEDSIASIREEHMFEDLQRTAEWSDRGAEIRIEAAAETSKAIAKIYADEHKRIVKVLKGFYKDEEDAWKKAAKEVESAWTDVARDLTRTFSSLFEDMVMDMNNFSEVWERFCESLTRVFVRQAAEMVAVELVGGLKGWGKGLLSIVGLQKETVAGTVKVTSSVGKLEAAVASLGAAVGPLSLFSAWLTSGYLLYKKHEDHAKGATKALKEWREEATRPWWVEEVGGARGRRGEREAARGRERGGRPIPPEEPGRRGAGVRGSFRFGGIVPGKLEMPKLQAGGIIRRPTFAAIGEGGPEAVIPLKHGKVPVELAGGSPRGAVIENMSISISAVFPNADLEHMSTGTLERVFRTKLVPVVENLAREGIFNSVITS